MKQVKLWILAAILTICGTNAQAQTKRSDDFHAKYKLKAVVVMSRHNIRSPLSSGSADYQRVTPHTWFAWTSPSSQLSLRGGVLETEMGQFFRKWVVSEGLLPDNYRPEGDEVLFPETENALELHTPIGSKLVFEKWSDGTNEYVAVNLVYQAVGQLQGRTLLSLDVPPMVLPITVEGLTANSDGLYLLSDLDTRMGSAMAEYEAIDDVPTDVNAAYRSEAALQPAAIYNLQGQRLNILQRGVNIVGGKKIVAE